MNLSNTSGIIFKLLCNALELRFCPTTNCKLFMSRLCTAVGFPLLFSLSLFTTYSSVYILPYILRLVIPLVERAGVKFIRREAAEEEEEEEEEERKT